MLGQVASDRFGPIGPFQVAIALTVVALVLVYFWPENRGESDDNDDDNDDNELSVIVPDKALSATSATGNKAKGEKKQERGEEKGDQRKKGKSAITTEPSSSPSPSSSSSSYNDNTNKESKESKDEEKDKDKDKDKGKEYSVLGSLVDAATLCAADRQMLFLGVSQAVFEGAIYTFVFAWYVNVGIRECGNT